MIDSAVLAMTDRVLSTEEAAKHLGIHPDTLRAHMLRKDHPPGRKIGRRWRFLQSALDRYLAGEPWQSEIPVSGVRFPPRPPFESIS